MTPDDGGPSGSAVVRQRPHRPPWATDALITERRDEMSRPYLQLAVDHASLPFSPGSLLHSLAGAATAGIAGLIAGALAARAIRSLGLHWSWSAIALAATVVLRSALGPLSLFLATATLAATVRGRRRHLEDLDAGADLAARARGRLALVDAARLAVGTLAVRRRSARKEWFRAGEMILGRDNRGALVSIPFGGARGGSHMLVVGATGSGKTVTETWTAVRAIERGMGAVVIDPKGDCAMRCELMRAAARSARTFIEWTPTGPNVYNPYASGGETEIADKLLAGERFSEPHYLRQAQRYLGHVVRALHAAGYEASLHAVAYHLDPHRLEQLVREVPAAGAQSTLDYLDSLSSRQTAELAGVRDRLAIVAESDVGRWLDPSVRGARKFDLREAIRERAVVYFDLAADSRPLLTQMLGAAIVQDLTTTVAVLQRSPVSTVVVIDEFASIAAEQIVRLFGRARSAGMSLVLGTQELADLRVRGRESLLEQVLGNLAVLLAHRQVVPRSAELIAALSGTAGAWRTSRHGDGRVTSTRASESVLNADEVMRLGPGVAAAIVLTHESSTRITRVFSLESKEHR
jgi:Type IV secretion-system coupling protein DNA-binding domain